MSAYRRLSDRDDLYRTTDFTLAAFLVADGWPLVETVWHHDGLQERCHWFFSSTRPEFTNAVMAYTGGEARVEPGGFHTSLNRVRRAMNAAK